LLLKTIDAYGRCLADFLQFCGRWEIVPQEITREQIALYVQDLALRPNPRGQNILQIGSGAGLANATMQQRITVVRLFCDYMVENQLRTDNPVGRGRYVPGKGFAGTREKGLISRHKRLPWIPSDEQWETILCALKEESLRNQLMFLLAYDGALRREELVRLDIADFDFAYQQITVRAEHAKRGRERIVGYGNVTGRFLKAYLQRRRSLSAQHGALFLSESRRNPAQPLSLVMWSKVVQRLAERCNLPQLSTHTTQHLRLTHLARAKMDLHQIALYAGHRSLETTMLYIHLSGVELAEAVAKGLAGFESWIENILGEGWQ
jgi:site-specific recombinase XerD